MRIVFDLEGDGLRHEATKVWCFVGYDLDSKKTFVATEYNKINEILSGADELIGHNIINYDLPVLKKLNIFVPSKEQKVTDTLVLSRLLFPDRKNPKGMTGKSKPHSIEAWGYRFGVPKPEHEDWSQYSPEMLHRCKEDVRIQVKLYRYLMQKEWGDWDWSFASWIEHEVARIITEQEDNGFAFNLSLARQRVQELTERIDSCDNQIKEVLSKEVQNLGPVNKPFKKDGSYSKMVIDYFGVECPSSYVVGPFSRISFIDPQLGSRQKIAKQLLRLGWKPKHYTDKGSPKLTVDGQPCDSLDAIGKKEGGLIAERFILSHRRSQIQGWIEAVRPDGRITAGANPLGTPTGRMTHSVVVNVPKATPHVRFGKEMRELFTVTDYGNGDYVLCGHDADGLELRTLGHHMDDPDFIRAVDEGKKEDGTDVHTVNQRKAGLDNRDLSKTTIYLIIYGGGDAKLAKELGITVDEAREVRRKLLEGLPKLQEVINRLKRQAKKGYVVGLDGRKMFLRRDPNTGKVLEHKALSTQNQGDGAIVMKLSMIYLNIMVKNRQLDVRKVIDQHDEAQAEVHKKDSKKYMELSCKSVVKAGQRLKLKCPLKASAQVGKNWSETH